MLITTIELLARGRGDSGHFLSVRIRPFFLQSPPNQNPPTISSPLLPSHHSCCGWWGWNLRPSRQGMASSFTCGSSTRWILLLAMSSSSSSTPTPSSAASRAYSGGSPPDSPRGDTRQLPLTWGAPAAPPAGPPSSALPRSTTSLPSASGSPIPFPFVASYSLAPPQVLKLFLAPSCFFLLLLR